MKSDSQKLHFYQSPLFYFGIALFVASLFSGFGFVTLASIGLSMVAVDFIVRALINRLWVQLCIQFLLVGLVSFGLYNSSATMKFNIEVTFPADFAGKYLILFGLSGYPEIKDGQAIMPEDGVLRTSTELGYDAVVGKLRFKGTKQQVKIDGMGAGACGEIGFISGTVKASEGDSTITPKRAAGAVWDSLMLHCDR